MIKQRIASVFLNLILLTHLACAQPKQSDLLGGWYVATDMEFNDLIILRSDNKYFVYNPGSVDFDSLALTGTGMSNNVKIDGSLTAMTERGLWEYDRSANRLILKDRHILEIETDFSDAYGKSDMIEFNVREATQNMMELCFKVTGHQQCNVYRKAIWPVDSIGRTISYREIDKVFTSSGAMSQTFELTGYETELRLDCEHAANSFVLRVEDESGNTIWSSNGFGSGPQKEVIVPLRGLTKLTLKVSHNGRWKVRIRIW